MISFELDRSRFYFGLEAEFLLADAETLAPLWHRELRFEELNEILEGISLEGLPPLTGLELERPHRVSMPYVVEGFHMFRDGQPVDILPKGVEIRTPICDSLEQCMGVYRKLLGRMRRALRASGLVPVPLSHHPLHTEFEGPQGTRRHDYWQWAMGAMTTYGPDFNISIPQELDRKVERKDLDARLNHYAPALTALSVAAPFYRGTLWSPYGSPGQSVRTYHRSVRAPIVEYHPEESGRYEFKPMDMSWRSEEIHLHFLLWLAVLLDKDLKGRADNATRIYELGAVARHGLRAPGMIERVGEVITRAPAVLGPLGFDLAPFAVAERRLSRGETPADELIHLWREGELAAVIRHLATPEEPEIPPRRNADDGRVPASGMPLAFGA